MSLDLTGIDNINGFYTDHYLAAYFEENVREAARGWKEKNEKDGTPIPSRRLRETSNQFYRAFGRYWSQGEGDRIEATQEMALAYVEALGYGQAPQAIVELNNGDTIPVWREYSKDDEPQLWVVLAYASTEGEDVLSSSLVSDDAAILSDFTVSQALDQLFFATEHSPRFILAISMNQIVFFDRNKWGEKKAIAFDLVEVFRRKEDTTFQAMATLISASSLLPQEGETVIDELDRSSQTHAAGVSDSLKYALRECVELLGNEVIYDWTHNKDKNLDDDPIDEGELTVECLRYMYRILFLLFMEARPELGFAPMKSEVYLKSYSLESLRGIAESVRDGVDTIPDESYLFDDTLRKTFSLVYDGYPKQEDSYSRLQAEESTHDVFVVPPLKAHIFDQERTRLVSGARLRDKVMIRIVSLMSVTKPSGRARRERISYDTLGINQLGSVYEGLLSYRGFIAKEDLYEVKKAGSRFDPLDVGYFIPQRDLALYEEDERVRYEEGDCEGQLREYRKGEFIYRLAGRQRESSASYYTPESLTHCLVKYALKELLKDKSAEDILQLTICEPAMGSAAFLNEVTSQLAEAYIERREEETGKTIPYDSRAYELQRVKMYIADKNVFGIDLNPIAVELGEVSLWLNTISQDGYVPWFGDQLHCGNSLVGARRRAYTQNQLKSKAPGIRWYDNEPERVGYETGCSKSHRVYHFLVGDPGMASYKDAVVKKLEPQCIAQIKSWNKAFTKPYNDIEVRSLNHLSYVVDSLWEQQIQQQRSMRAETQDRLSVWEHADEGELTHLTIRQKDSIYARLYLSEHAKNAGPYARLKFAMDYWCALWFWPIEKAEELPTRDEFLNDMAMILEGTVGAAIGFAHAKGTQMHLPGFETEEEKRLDFLQEQWGTIGEVDIDKLCQQIPRLETARTVAEEQHFFHWELEFADTFEVRGGFDLIVGNPPWVKLEWKEQNALSEMDPRFAIKGYSAPETARRRDAPLAEGVNRSIYLHDYVNLAAEKTFLNAAQNYPLLKGQQTNLYRCFLPQSWNFGVGVQCFVHPDGILNDSNAGAMRREMLARYRKHFQFENEHGLFKGTNDHGRMKFALNIYGAPEVPQFDSIHNLYEPSTIDECYASNGLGDVPGIKTADGEWNTSGHSNRIIHIGEDELRTFATLQGDENWRCSRVLNVHAQSLMDILDAIAAQNKKVRSLGDEVFMSECWHETGAVNDGTIGNNIVFPTSWSESIYSGAQIGVANPLYQTTRAVYVSNNDYDPVDLTNIPEDYLIRVKYQRACSREEYLRRMPRTPWGKPLDAEYHLVNREYVGCASERTLQTAILPPGACWINKVFGIQTPCLSTIALLAGYTSSIPLDYYVRAIGKADVNYATTMTYPLVDSPFNPEIECRALLLNCLTRAYAKLWRECWQDDWQSFGWSKDDPRLPESTFASLSEDWEWGTPLRTDFARRQALVELDVLVSQALGLTLDQLITVYRLDFSVLQSYEKDTWYDQNGRVLFSKKTLDKSRLTRPEWERVRNRKTGVVQQTYIDDTLPGGPRERTITYQAPFDCCDRIEDYKVAWSYFEHKYGKQGSSR